MNDDDLRRLLTPDPQDGDYGAEFHGPFIEHYRLTVDGYHVPHLTAQLVPGTEDHWNLVCDGRFMLDAPGEEIRRWLWFVANCMAVAAGYSCHGENCRPINPYMLRMSRIDRVQVGGDGE